MAEWILRQSLLDAGNSNITVSSAGIAAVMGHPAAEEVQQLMGNRGFDISAHRATQLVPEMLLHADLVLVMEKEQRRTVEQQQPAVRGRVYRLGEWGDFDIPDPYRQGMSAYKKAMELVDRGVIDWMGRIG